MLLNAHSHYSLRYGTLPIKDLVERAFALGHKNAAITDLNTTAAHYDFQTACNKIGLSPLYGAEFRERIEGGKCSQLLFIAIARNVDGIEELNTLLSETALQGLELPRRAPDSWQDGEVIYPPENAPEDLKPWEWIGLRPSLLRHLPARAVRKRLDRCVIWQPVTYADSTGYKLHRILRAIDGNTLLSKLTPTDHAPADEALVDAVSLQAAFANYPEVVRNTEQLAERCSGIKLDMSHAKNRQTYTGNVADDRGLLSKLAFEGMQQRYGRASAKIQKEAKKRVQNELEVIMKLGFGSYFLITWDIVRYAQHRGIYHVGRGSGANSIVAYCLTLTDVCPIELDLYFERFLNPSRTSPPDFDLDFSWDDRDEVIDYIFKRYGHRHTSLMGAYSTFGYSSTVREVGKTLGLPKAELDVWADNPLALENSKGVLAGALRKAIPLLDECPNYLSIHAGGILISERPIMHYTALQPMPKGFPTTHIDMYMAEDAGFYKYDILSQRGLGHIKTAIKLAQENRGERIDIHRVQDFKEDPKLKTYIRKGDTLGCFYIESPAMRQLLTKLRCDDYIRLVAASSIIRPGVAKSGMMRQYIERFHDPNKVQYLHPKMEELLKETYGVMVYQEDVIKVAHHFGGLSAADGDILRRAMSGKYRSRTEFQRIVDTYYANCSERGYPPEIAKEVWRQIESFSGYSFSKAHSASFAVESYQSLFLKVYYPLEFIVGVINNFGGFYSTSVYVHQARKMGGIIHAPCIQRSRQLTHLFGSDIYLGFIHIKGLETQWQRAIPEAREQAKFESLDDFITRVPLPLEQLVLLIRVGALRSLGEKKALLWLAHQKLRNRPKPEPVLFLIQRTEYQLPALVQNQIEDYLDELELLGLTTVSPFVLYPKLPEGIIRSSELMQHLGKTVEMLAWYVARKPVRTVRGDVMYFGCWMDDRDDLFDSVHFPRKDQPQPFRGSGFYHLRGKVVEEFGHPSLEVSHCEIVRMAERVTV
jgi:error-prone DNA polymerase